MRCVKQLSVWLASTLVLSACGGGAPPTNDADFTKAWQAWRATREAFFRQASGSPIPRDKVDTLLPLTYFPPDPDYVAPASLKLASTREVVDMPTSTGEVRKEERVGVLEFSLRGQPLTLSAFVEAGSQDMSRLFVPFRDLTSGTETYQAGRYLDLDRTATGLYNVDFNRAYHPYCYYNSTFDCPYPPAENRLPIPIRAGERLPPSAPASH